MQLNANKPILQPRLIPYLSRPTHRQPINFQSRLPTPTGTLWPSSPHVPTPESSAMLLPIVLMRFSV